MHSMLHESGIRFLEGPMVKVEKHRLSRAGEKKILPRCAEGHVRREN